MKKSLFDGRRPKCGSAALHCVTRVPATKNQQVPCRFLPEKHPRWRTGHPISSLFPWIFNSQVKTSEEHKKISEMLLEILGDRLVEQVTPFAKEQEAWLSILLGVCWDFVGLFNLSTSLYLLGRFHPFSTWVTILLCNLFVTWCYYELFFYSPSTSGIAAVQRISSLSASGGMGGIGCFIYSCPGSLFIHKKKDQKMGTNPASKKQKLPHFPTERLAKKGVTI